MRSRLLLSGIALVSLAGMLLEIALTRVFSVIFFYHYVFAILSAAVLGIGLGAAIVHQRSETEATRDPSTRLQLLAALTGGTVIGLAALIAFTLSIDGRILMTAAVALPYVLIGMTLATAFTAYTGASPKLYWADLSGAGLGAAAAIPLLNWLGGFSLLLLTSLPFLAASICFRLAAGRGRATEVTRAPPSAGPLNRAAVPGRPNSQPISQRPDLLYSAAAITLVILALLGVLGWGNFGLDVSRLATPKPLTLPIQDDPGARVIHTRWDAFARTDVLESAADPSQKLIFIDGAAGSAMPRYPSTPEEENRVTSDIGYFPFLQKPEQVYIIGPGGGKDVLFALLAGSRDITAAEVSPSTVDAVRAFSDFNGHLFSQPEVKVVVDEGRSYLRRGDRQYDMIYLSEVISLSAERSSYMLAENYIYTVEAFQDYVAHLATGGVLALKLYDELTLTRAFTTAVAALRQGGLTESEAARRMVVLVDPNLATRETPLRSPLLLVYRDPVTPEAAGQLLAAARAADLIPLLVPHVHEEPPLSDLTTGRTTLDAMVADFSRADISPTSDDRPFFYEFRRGLPDVLRRLLVGLGAALIVSLVYLCWRGCTLEGPFWPLAAYFALLGAGFLLIELAVIQRLTLFLGHPTTALSVSLFAILISSGLGSLAGGWLAGDHPRRTIMLAALATGLLVIVYVNSKPANLEGLAHLPLAARSVTAVALIFPLAFPLGLPFPLGLQIAQEEVGRAMVPLAWGINGVTSVVGAVSAMAIAMLWNFNVVLVVAGLIYGVVAVLAFVIAN